MKKSKFSEAQIVFAIKQSETGIAVNEVCRKMGVSVDKPEWIDPIPPEIYLL